MAEENVGELTLESGCIECGYVSGVRVIEKGGIGKSPGRRTGTEREIGNVPGGRDRNDTKANCSQRCDYMSRGSGRVPTLVILHGC